LRIKAFIAAEHGVEGVVFLLNEDDVFDRVAEALMGGLGWRMGETVSNEGEKNERNKQEKTLHAVLLYTRFHILESLPSSEQISFLGEENALSVVARGCNHVNKQWRLGKKRA
jgi:hypothetical protein